MEDRRAYPSLNFHDDARALAARTPFHWPSDGVARLRGLVRRIDGLGPVRWAWRNQPDEDGLVVEAEVRAERVLAFVVMLAPDEESVVVSASLADPEPGPELRLVSEVEWPARDAAELLHAVGAAVELLERWGQGA